MHKVLELIAKNSPHLSWIKDRTMLLVRHGSMAYGTNVETSDEDFRGIAIPTKDYFFSSIKNFNQAELKDPDAVIFNINKFFNLAIDNNPHVIEILHVDPNDIMYISKLGEKLVERKDEFLSQRVKYTFSGYAISQLKRIKTHRNHILNPPKAPPLRKDFGLEEHSVISGEQLQAITASIQKEMDKLNFNFMDHLEDDVKYEIKKSMISILSEYKIYSDDMWKACAKKVGLNDNFIEILFKERQYANAKKDWDNYITWKNARNPVRHAMEEKFGYDGKHGLHLIRLLKMCKEIVSSGKVIVKRPDAEELVGIRQGLWSYDKLISEAEKLEKEIEQAFLTTKLPKVADKVKLDNFCIELIEGSF